MSNRHKILSNESIKNVSIHQIEIRNMENGGHYFDVQTKKYFKSRTNAEVFYKLGEKRGYFIDGTKHLDQKRRYTIKSVDLITGLKIQTIGEFQQYDNLEQAYKKINSILNGSE